MHERAFRNRAQRVLRQAMIQWHRIELIIAAMAGAVVGIVAGKLLEHERLGILIWALIGAIAVSGVVYLHRLVGNERWTKT